MWLSDYKKAIKEIEKVFGNCCFEQIKGSLDGERIIFYTSYLDNLENYIYYRRTGKIIKCFNDTWRNPDHIEVIKEGK